MPDPFPFRAPAALREHEALFCQLAERTQVPLLVSSVTTSEILVSNPAFDRVFADGASMSARAAIALYENPADRAAIVTILRRAGRVVNHPVRMRGHDGVVRAFLCSTTISTVGEPLALTSLRDASEPPAAEAVLMLTRDGRVAGQRSSAGALGAAAAGETFWSYVARIDAVFAEWFEVAWRVLTRDQLPMELAMEQLPRTLRTAARGFSVEYTPIPSRVGAHRLERMLVVISEVTERDAAAAFRQLAGASRLSGSG